MKVRLAHCWAFRLTSKIFYTLTQTLEELNLLFFSFSTLNMCIPESWIAIDRVISLESSSFPWISFLFKFAKF